MLTVTADMPVAAFCEEAHLRIVQVAGLIISARLDPDASLSRRLEILALAGPRSATRAEALQRITSASGPESDQLARRLADQGMKQTLGSLLSKPTPTTGRDFRGRSLLFVAYSLDSCGMRLAPRVS